MRVHHLLYTDGMQCWCRIQLPRTVLGKSLYVGQWQAIPPRESVPMPWKKIVIGFFQHMSMSVGTAMFTLRHLTAFHVASSGRQGQHLQQSKEGHRTFEHVVSCGVACRIEV